MGESSIYSGEPQATTPDVIPNLKEVIESTFERDGKSQCTFPRDSGYFPSGTRENSGMTICYEERVE